MKTGLVGLLSLFTVIGLGEERATPDILLIMLDDSGYTDFGCYGSEIDTPRIDALAAEGIRFTDCHSAAPNCSPSRVGMLTGRMPTRAGMYSYVPAAHPMHLRDEEITIAELLKEKGYATGHFGKWHVSDLDGKTEGQPQPGDQGFDHSLGTSNNAEPSHLDPVNFVRNGEKIGKQEGYSCQIVADEFNEWLSGIDVHSSFLGVVWFHEPHSKIASPSELVAKYQERLGGGKKSRKQAEYYANIENVDIAVGRILDQLEKSGRAGNTLVFLTSDNGGVNSWSNEGLRGRKSFVWEGGHREPGILRLPGRVPVGKVDDTLISHLDLLPTICELTHTKIPDDRPIDGVSLVPLFSGNPIERKTPLMWFFYRVVPAAAMRKGEFVVIGYLDDPIKKHTHPLTAPDMPMIKSAPLTQFELYHLGDDLAQENELSASHPDILKKMSREMKALHTEIVAEGHVWKFGEKK